VLLARTTTVAAPEVPPITAYATICNTLLVLPATISSTAPRISPAANVSLSEIGIDLLIQRLATVMHYFFLLLLRARNTM
jgi:hypothetical protein